MVLKNLKLKSKETINLKINLRNLNIYALKYIFDYKTLKLKYFNILSYFNYDN